MVASCVQMYKAGRTCQHNGMEDEPCCSTAQTDVFRNAWAMRQSHNNDSLVSTDESEVDRLRKNGWDEQCNAINGPTSFCVNSSIEDGREGPFMLYADNDTTKTALGDVPVALYRCVDSKTGKHYLNAAPAACGEQNDQAVLLGFVSPRRGGETLRALYRCRDASSGRMMHSLDLACDTPDGDGRPLGFVR